MNKILFDGIATQSPTNVKYHGGSEYAKYILKYALENGYSNFDFVYSSDMFLHENVEDLLEQYNIKQFCLKNKKELQYFIRSNKYTCFYSALPYNYGNFDFCDISVIFTIHGCRQIELPSDSYRPYYSDNYFHFFKILFFDKFFSRFFYYKTKRSFRKLVQKKNEKIVTVSNHSKYALLSFFPNIQGSDLLVNYSPMNFDIKEVKESIDVIEDYFLLISSNRFEKNAYRAILAFDQLFSEGRLDNKKVIILGADGCSLIKRVHNKSKFIFEGYVSENLLIAYFKKAFAFVYPSLNEGFGYPPVMAMLYGIPAICSAVTSIPEICKDAVDYFNPYDINEIKNRVLYISEDSHHRETMIHRGYERSNELKELQKSNMNALMKYIFIDN